MFYSGTSYILLAKLYHTLLGIFVYLLIIVLLSKHKLKVEMINVVFLK